MNNKDNIDNEIKHIDEIVPPLREIRSLKGERLKLPPVTLGKELRIMRLLLEFLKSGGYLDSEAVDRSFSNILLNAFCNDEGNKLLLDMFALIVDKPPEWLLENVDLTSMMGCLLPFLVQRLQSLTKAMGGLGKIDGDILN